ncbi:YraN family protein [Corynebacterium pseudotuberculosis]|uniref:YraN family protein n=1 Tax=Corynebacterium pseudotuberculosis TaxID=1719 RepID=UPI0010C524EE|nr:YraN family protein [Corynebacterium pseudotuberculosis]UTO23761.1 YraN family protein [Corynebacterium pseudotuberculosis]VTQ78765.1 ATP-dependent protease [Corynebacterium pseudotuberculosis]
MCLCIYSAESIFSIGKEGERIAAQWYQARGYEVVDCNAQFTVGELDLVLESPDGCLVFVEVKTRSTPFYGLGEAITAKKLRKMRKAAYLWLQDKRWFDIRFDAIVICISRDSSAQITCYEGIDRGAC